MYNASVPWGRDNKVYRFYVHVDFPFLGTLDPGKAIVLEYIGHPFDHYRVNGPIDPTKVFLEEQGWDTWSLTPPEPKDQ